MFGQHPSWWTLSSCLIARRIAFLNSFLTLCCGPFLLIKHQLPFLRSCASAHSPTCLACQVNFSKFNSSMVTGSQTPIEFGWSQHCLDINLLVVKVILGHDPAGTHLLCHAPSTLPCILSWPFACICLSIFAWQAPLSVRFRPSGYHADGEDIQPEQMGNNARYAQSDSPVSLVCQHWGMELMHCGLSSPPQKKAWNTSHMYDLVYRPGHMVISSVLKHLLAIQPCYLIKLGHPDPYRRNIEVGSPPPDHLM